MTTERASIQQSTSTTPANTSSVQQLHLRAGILFTFVLAAGVVLAAGIAPHLQGFDRWVMLSMGTALVAAATAFILVVTFLVEARYQDAPLPPQCEARHRA